MQCPSSMSSVSHMGSNLLDTRRSPEAKHKSPCNPSAQKKEIVLFEWWLSKAEKDYNGSRLTISGFTKSGKATRIFDSSPIIKRHDAYTIETADGITIRIEGFIDMMHTLDNGFPIEIHCTPLTRYEREKSINLKPESLKRSRSGRLLIPSLDCSTKAVYEPDGSFVGTATVDLSCAPIASVAMSTSPSKGRGRNITRKKRKKLQ